MPTHMDATSAVASADTTPTTVGSITPPSGADRRIIGIWAYAVVGGTLTSGESVSGILELDSTSVSIKPFKIPLSVVQCLTSGSFAYEPRIIPVEDLVVPGGAVITAQVTLDMATTVAFLVRWGVIYAPW